MTVDTKSHSYQLGTLEYKFGDLCSRLRVILAVLPDKAPPPAYEVGFGWRSSGNTDDVAADAVDEALWKVAERIRAALEAVGSPVKTEIEP